MTTKGVEKVTRPAEKKTTTATRPAPPAGSSNRWLWVALALLFAWMVLPFGNRSGANLKEEMVALRAEVDQLNERVGVPLQSDLARKKTKKSAKKATAKQKQIAAETKKTVVSASAGETSDKEEKKAMMKVAANSQPETRIDNGNGDATGEQSPEALQEAVQNELTAARWAAKKNGALVALLFEFGSAELTDASKQHLNTFIEGMSGAEGETVEIVGYTDAIGEAENNLRLGTERVNSVYQFLSENGLDSDRAQLSVFSKDKFLGSNDTPFGRMVNRRVEIVVR